MNVTTTSFDQDVIQASFQKPVLVDFWAPWCGPCRVIGPILEKLSTEQASLWTLAKINTDENPEVSAQFGIRGIPAVKLFVNGTVSAEFVGALPEVAIRQWLEKELPSENKNKLSEAKKALESGETQKAIPILEEVLQVEPTNPEARILLAGQLIFSDPVRAQELAQAGSFAGQEYVQKELAIKAMLSLLQLQRNPNSLPESPVKPVFVEALNAVSKQDFDTALNKIIEVLQKDRYYHKDIARKAGVSIFTFLGDEHPLTLKYRRTFDMWLY